jgi:hypothetical protein
MSPKEQPRSRPVPTQRTTMSCHAGGHGQTPQTTCRRRPSSTTTESYARALEITHAFRLRQKLRSAGAGDLVVNVWGVGLRLSPAPLEEST